MGRPDLPPCSLSFAIGIDLDWGVVPLDLMQDELARGSPLVASCVSTVLTTYGSSSIPVRKICLKMCWYLVQYFEYIFGASAGPQVALQMVKLWIDTSIADIKA